MDANAKPEPVNPDPHPAPAAPSPPTRAGEPASDDPPPPETLGEWFRLNWKKLLFIALVVGVILRTLHPLDLILAAGGLSLIIFLHELGHFLAAKWCDVQVDTFSIGFGPALPFCQYKYGETTYKLAMIPLGGFVGMLGETENDAENGTEEEAEENPRSFKNKTVGQRMLIISAGVIMNLILGCVCFVITYLNGVQEKPAIASHVESGSAAWRAGIHSGTEIERINGRSNPWFDDIRPIISSTSKGEVVDLDLEYRGKVWNAKIEPVRAEGAPFPQLGIAPPEQLVLRTFRRDELPPYQPGSRAAAAKAAGDAPGFLPGDHLRAMTDPDDPAKVTPFHPKPDGLPGEFFDYAKRLQRLAGKPVTFHVTRKGEPADAKPTVITVDPAFRWDTGLRMRMGEVASIRQNSPAERAGVQAAQTGDTPVPGDRIVSVEVPEPAGGTTKFVAGVPDGKSAANEKLLDPLRLPHDLDQWADRSPGNRKLTVTVLRVVDHTEKRVPLEMTWDHSFRYDLARPTSPGSPVPVGGLGLAYHVEAVVNHVVKDSPAAAAGFQPNDKITHVRFKSQDHKGTEVKTGWAEIRPNHWAFVDHAVQRNAPHGIDARVERAGQTVEVSVAAVEDRDWASPELGLEFLPETRLQKADGILDALEMGAYRTVRSIKSIYLGLYAMVFGRISPLMVSGPITLARASYIIAGEDVWHLLIWIGLISVNLAVVNFLPIPVLDGGHMVFLIYEGVRGKPAPPRVMFWFQLAGLAMIGCLMVFVVGLDVWRMF